ncbi:hypothetical protein [Sneathiella litorea]|uniref:Uncharacterized protein n=1 Tax=Sneathiella litorea TaxID=2606216 RepID=A0A6L8W3J8_9PROT|nr:hypothetical protein [Sneathiella litorea]MZR29621.1 hypothetical protein [Sneathiella litorea]
MMVIEDTSIKFVSCDVVVLASNHNPSILNPDMLKNNHIVPMEWEVSETITTPPLSLVQFKNGISIRVEERKLTVSENYSDSSQFEKSAGAIAQDYVTKLSFTNYTDLGLNWAAVIERQEPVKWVSDRFYVPGKWKSEPYEMIGCEATFSFDCGQFVSNVKISPRVVDVQDNASNGMIVFNINHNFRGGGAILAKEGNIAKLLENRNIAFSQIRDLVIGGRLS